MKILITLLLLLTVFTLPAQNTNNRKARKQEQQQPKDENKWLQRTLPSKNKGVSEVSPWHTGTAAIIANNGAELSLFNTSRIGFTKNTELLLRIAEEPFLPNLGIKHRWAGNDRLILSTEHTLYYTYPLLKILQTSGFKELVPDSVRVNHGIAMRNEILLSWLINPRTFGCPDPSQEKILTLRAGVEFYAGSGEQEVRPFDYFHSLYHTQIFDHNVLYYGGLQFDSYFATRFHYSVNALYYNIDFSKEYAVEGNLRLTYYVSRRVGISASCKMAYMDLAAKKQFTCLPLLDVTLLINPGRGDIRHGLFKKKRRS